MTGKGLIIVILGVIFISGYTFRNIFVSSKSLTDTIVDSYQRQTVNNIAQSGVNIAIRKLNSDPSWRAGFSLMPLMGGNVEVAIKDTIFRGQNVLAVIAVGYTDYNTSRVLRDTSVAYVSKGYIPATVKAAITTNNPIGTLGTLVVDGRNHDLLGNLVPGSGTNGIWTTCTLNQGGNSSIGGTEGTTDEVPTKPGDPDVIKTGQIWPGGYPYSPDSVLGGPEKGYPEGTLKAIAQSGINGSQYKTDPTTLVYPLRGVTYVELPSLGVWQSMSIDGTGILIVHNVYNNAIMKNLNGGTFKGLMIIDDIVHIHTTVIGAIIGTTSHPSEGNCIGNGSGDVLYSTEAIQGATSASGAATGYTSASRVISWYE